MNDLFQTNQELQQENIALKKRIHELEQLAAERKVAEDKLKESNERFKAFIDNGPGIAWIKDENGRHVYHSESFEKRFGLKHDEWLGKTDFELWPFETAEMFQKNDLRVLQEGRAVDIVEATTEPEGTITYWWNFNFLILDSSGRKYTGGFAIDITSQKRIEGELAIALQRLRFHMENTPLAEVEFDRDYRITRWSKKAQKIFGWTADEVLGKRIDDLNWVYEDDVQRISKLSAEMFSARRTSNIHTNRNYRKDGSVITCEWYNSALLNERKELVSVHSLALDITERVKTEEALRQREEQFRTLVNNMQDAIFRADLEGRITFTSPSAAQILGCSSVEEMVGMSIGSDFYLDPKEAQKHMEALQKNGKLVRQEVVLRRRDNGEPVIVSANIQFFHDAAGNVLGVEGVYRDVTENKRSEEALRESEARYRLLHSSMRDAFARVDFDGTFLEFNEAFLEMLGYSPEELGKLTYNDVTPEKWHALEAEIHEKQVFPRGYSNIFEKEYRRKDGTVFPVELRAFLLRDDAGNPTGMWALIRDITERKQVEKDREKLILELQEALKRVKTLSGMLPICASCKKIRDDKGYWMQIEAYIRDHSEAEFSHAICPDCMQKLYPDIYEKMKTDKQV